MDVQALQSALGYEFASRDLLDQALTHRSHSVAHNERLEFLGDSVLNCVVASLLFEKFAKIDEGDLSRLRANLVKQQSLYEIAQRLELSPYLRLGEGELKSGGFRRPSILADTVEALFGAIFLDGGFESARRVIRRLYLPVLETVDPRTLGKDSKTLLQEYLQGRKIALPVYTVVATHGAAHSQEFEVECAVPKLSIQVLGAGGSRRAAEQAAAKKALEAAQALAVAATKRTRRAKPAQLSLPVAVTQEQTAGTGDAIATAKKRADKGGETKPADVKAIESKGAEAKPVEPRAVESKHVEAKHVETKVVETKVAEPKLVDAKPADAKTPDRQRDADPAEAKASPKVVPAIEPARIVAASVVRASTTPVEARAERRDPAPESRDAALESTTDSSVADAETQGTEAARVPKVRVA